MSETPVRLNLGNQDDDDARYIDELLVDNVEPPTPPTHAASGHPTYVTPPQVTNRLLCYMVTLPQNFFDPVQLLPADPNRIKLSISASYCLDGSNQDVSPGPIAYAMRREDLFSPYTCFQRTRRDVSPWLLDGYTGALWVSRFLTSTTYASFDISLSVAAVTL